LGSKKDLGKVSKREGGNVPRVMGGGGAGGGENPGGGSEKGGERTVETDLVRRVAKRNCGKRTGGGATGG